MTHEINAPLALTKQLNELQETMTKTNHWSTQFIPPKALLSTEPFCMDTMDFGQWLQFIFIPRMRAIIDGKHPLPRLPKDQGISPMAADFFKDNEQILSIIQTIDKLLEA